MSTEVSIEEKYKLKTDDGNNNDGKQGRVYSQEYAMKPGGVRVDEMIYGIKMAHLSCTDNTENRLKTSSANTIAALGEVIGINATDPNPSISRDEIKLPLSTLLDKYFNLNLDCWIDESYWHKMSPVDTQGFIASNDDTIVLSYRFSTSKMDWLTNFSMTTSEWEPNKDELLGHAGMFSCIDGLFSKYFSCIKPGNKKSKPRVHTGFYNNFLHTIPMIRKHIINKLLDPTTTPKKVFICGCSLGAAISTAAYMFVLDEMVSTLENPNYTNHKLILVNAGSPRVCVHKEMKHHVMEKINRLRPLDRAVLCRIVFNNDAVPHIPINLSGFIHLDKLIYITKDGKDVLINPIVPAEAHNIKEVVTLFQNLTKKTKDDNTIDNNNNTTTEEQDDGTIKKTQFEIECEQAAEPVRDHMPYFYLTYLQQLEKRING